MSLVVTEHRDDQPSQVYFPNPIQFSTVSFVDKTIRLAFLRYHSLAALPCCGSLTLKLLFELRNSLFHREWACTTVI